MAEVSTSEATQKPGLDLKIIIIGLFIFIAAIGASFFIMKGLMAPMMPQSQAEKEEGAVEIGVLVPIGEFMTNINDVGGTRYLKVEVTIETADSESQEKINTYMPVIRDSIQSILGTKTVADLAPGNHDALKQEMKEDINAKIGIDTVNNVYFTSFIMQ